MANITNDGSTPSIAAPGRAHTWQSSVQVEHAFASNLTASLSLMYAKGSQLPVVTDGRITLGDTPGLGLAIDIAAWQTQITWQGHAGDR